LDGNGRIGRLLITLYLIDKGILQQPLLYLSEFFERNKRLYYDNLILVREQNNLVQWLKYFLVGIDQTAKRASDTLAAILKLKENTEDMLRKNGGRRTDSALTLLNHLFTDPVIRIKDAENICNLTKKSANALIQLMAEMNILKEISGKTRNRIYLFKEYLDLFR
jgi:Fic family protein